MRSVPYEVGAEAADSDFDVHGEHEKAKIGHRSQHAKP